MRKLGYVKGVKCVSSSKEVNKSSKHSSALVLGKTVFYGRNEFWFKDGKPIASLHAEVDVIKDYLKLGGNSKFLKSAMLFVIRYNTKDQTFANSCPCDNCKRFIKKFGIKKVIYSTGKDTFIEWES